MPDWTIWALVFRLLISPGVTARAGAVEWSAVGPYIEYPWVNVLAASASTLYVGTPAGVFSSGDGTVWTRINEGMGLNFNNVRALVIDPAFPSTVYAGTYGGGVFKTENGHSWRPVNNGLTKLTVQVMAVAPGSPATIYAGTLGKVFKTSNGGSTWIPLDNSLPDMNITSIAVDPTRPSTVYIGTFSAGVFKSSNGGESWVQTGLATDGDPSNPGIYALAVDPSSPETVYAGAYRLGGYRTFDGGATWSGLNLAGARALAIDPRAPSTLYASNGSGLYKSNDRGTTWTKLTDRSGELAVDGASDPSTLYVGGLQPARSTDGGATWQTLACCYPLEVYQIAGARGRSRIYAASRSAVFRSDDGGGKWIDVTKGLNAGFSGYFFRSLAVDPSSDTTVYAGSAGLARTLDGGATWALIQVGLPPFPFPNAIAMDPRSSATLYVGLSAGGVFKSTDRGDHWTGTSLVGNITALAIDARSPSVLYAGTPGRGVFKSSDGGASWVAGNSGLSDLGISSIALDAESTVFVTTGGGGVFRSDDGGSSWFSRSAGLPALPLYSVAIDAIVPSTLYVGTGGFGVFRSLDGGGHWTPIGLGSTGQFGALFLNSVEGSTLYAGTESGLFRLSFGATNPGRLPSIVPVR